MVKGAVLGALTLSGLILSGCVTPPSQRTVAAPVQTARQVREIHIEPSVSSSAPEGSQPSSSAGVEPRPKASPRASVKAIPLDGANAASSSIQVRLPSPADMVERKVARQPVRMQNISTSRNVPKAPAPNTSKEPVETSRNVPLPRQEPAAQETGMTSLSPILRKAAGGT